MSSVTIEKAPPNECHCNNNGAQFDCHGSTATKTQFGIQSSPLLETVSPDKLVMAAPSTRGIAVKIELLGVIALIMTWMASGDHSCTAMTKLSCVAFP